MTCPPMGRLLKVPAKQCKTNELEHKHIKMCRIGQMWKLKDAILDKWHFNYFFFLSQSKKKLFPWELGQNVLDRHLWVPMVGGIVLVTMIGVFDFWFLFSLSAEYSVSLVPIHWVYFGSPAKSICHHTKHISFHFCVSLVCARFKMWIDLNIHRNGACMCSCIGKSFSKDHSYFLNKVLFFSRLSV